MRIRSQYNLGPNPLLTKVIPIGVWNMVATPSVTVPHGLSLASIRKAYAIISNDSSTELLPLDFSESLVSPDGQLYCLVTGTYLTRRATGAFDNINYDDGAMNRGYVTIEYIQ